MTLSLESLDARMKFVEAKLGIAPVEPSPSKFMFGFKADEEEFPLVVQMGAEWVSTSRWPNGKLSQASIDLGKSGKLKILPRYQREKSATKPPLMPLVTTAEIDAFLAIVNSDSVSFKEAKCEWIGMGNEWDALYIDPVTKVKTYDRFWGGKNLYDAGRYWCKPVGDEFRKLGLRPVWELPQRDINSIPEFVRGLVDSKAYQNGDPWSFHAYGQTADGHYGRHDQAIAAVESVLKRKIDRKKEWESSEMAVIRGGPPEGKIRETDLLIDRMMDYFSRAFGYRIRVKERHNESLFSPIGLDNKPTMFHPSWTRGVALANAA